MQKRVQQCGIKMKLRPYQSESVQAIYNHFGAKTTNPVVVLPTGAGKSHVIAAFVHGVMDIWPDQRIIMLTHVKELIEQNLDKLLTHWPEAPAGVYSSGIGRRDTDDKIIFAGIQSVYQRSTELGRFDLALCDECHLINHRDDGMYRRFLREQELLNPKIKVVGFTATPFRTQYGSITKATEDDSPIFQDIAYEKPLKELIDEGYLSMLIPKQTKQDLDVKHVKIRAGDFVQKDLQKAVDRQDINAAAVREMIDCASDRKSWLVFCVGIAHSNHVASTLNQFGISAAAITSRTPKQDREQIIADFKAGKLRALTNANVLCLDERTEILTSDGFVGIDEMTYSHKIAAWKKDGGVEFSPPEHIVRREKQDHEKMVELGGGIAANIRVTENHRMVIRCGDRRSKIKIVQAGLLKNVPTIAIPTTGECAPDIILVDQPTYKQDKKKHIRTTSYNYRKRGFSDKMAKLLAVQQVERLRSMRHKDPHELTTSECELIGFWLGDGTKSCGRVSIAQSERYGDTVSYVENLLAKTSIHASRKVYPPASKSKHNSVRWTLARGTGGFSQNVNKGYFEIEPYLDKEGSRYLWGLNKSQLKALLNGFWMADGNHHTKNQKYKYIIGTQYKLYSLLQAICSVRGISSSIGSPIKPRKRNHNLQWKFAWGERKSWNYKSENNVFVSNGLRKERVWCVTSSTSFLICRRNGKVFVTGNTTGFDAPQVDMIAFLRPTMSPVLFLQMAGRGTRLAPGKENCLVLDFAGNTMRHGPVDQITGWDPKKRNPGKAPTKTCPECDTINHTAVRECINPLCRYEFPIEEEEEKFDKKASTLELISGTTPVKKPTWYQVKRVYYHRHQKRNDPGALPTLRVTYSCTNNPDVGIPIYQNFSEWICFEHTGYARTKAEAWWSERVITEDCPASVDRAFKVLGQLTNGISLHEPIAIRVDESGRYPRILDHAFESIRQVRSGSHA